MGNRSYPNIREFFQYKWQSSRLTLSLAMVYLCVAVFILVCLLDLLHIIEKRNVFIHLGLSYYGIANQHWYWQFLTAPFLHANITHLLFNMLALWMLGPDVEKALGRRGYIALLIISSFSALIATLFANAGTGTIVIGFSGVIFGILVAQAIYFPEHRIVLFYFFPIKMKYAVILLAAISLYLTISPGGGVVSHISHLFGAVGAFLYLILRKKMSKSLRFEKTKEKISKAKSTIRKAQIERKVPRRL